MTRRIPLLVMAFALSACDRGPEEASPEVLAARQQAMRRACVGAELARRAEDQFQTLEATLPGGDNALSAGIGTAALQFARAYQQHAQLRAAAYAHVDSALNRSEREADSVRHAQAAERFTIRAPEAGTLEANVFQAYERDLDTLLADPDHPCNWDLEG